MFSQPVTVAFPSASGLSNCKILRPANISFTVSGAKNRIQYIEFFCAAVPVHILAAVAYQRIHVVHKPIRRHYLQHVIGYIVAYQTKRYWYIQLCRKIAFGNNGERCKF